MSEKLIGALTYVEHQVATERFTRCRSQEEAAHVLGMHVKFLQIIEKRLLHKLQDTKNSTRSHY